MVGMLIKQALNFLTVILQLVFQSQEQLYHGQCQSTFGSCDHRSTAELESYGEDLQALFVELRTIKTLNVQKLLPPSAPRFVEQFRCRKLLHKFPTWSRCPILKGLQSCGKIFIQRGLELVDQFCPLGDQFHFIAA